MSELVEPDMKILPPPGSMQFEFLAGKLSRRDSMRGSVSKRPKWVWVGPPQTAFKSCDCTKVYPVLTDFLPIEIRDECRRIMRENGQAQAFECNCRGRIRAKVLRVRPLEASL